MKKITRRKMVQKVVPVSELTEEQLEKLEEAKNSEREEIDADSPEEFRAHFSHLDGGDS